MTIPPVTLTPAPPAGVWRIGRARGPLAYNQVEPETLDRSSAGRFSLYSYGMLYCATDRVGCFAEALALFRIAPRVRAEMGNAGATNADLMAIGHLPSSWREDRVLLRLRPTPQAQFLDVDSDETRTVLAIDLKEELSAFGVSGTLTDEHIHGKDRRIARQIAAWAVAQRNDHGHLLVQGITYRSTYGGRRIWAILRDTELTEVERCPVRLEDTGLQAVAKEYGLTVH